MISKVYSITIFGSENNIKEIQYYTELQTPPHVGYNAQGDGIHYYLIDKDAPLLSSDDTVG